MCPSGRGQVLMPWPNRLAGGRLRVRRPRSPAARERACHRLRDPRPRSLGRVEHRRARAPPRRRPPRSAPTTRATHSRSRSASSTRCQRRDCASRRRRPTSATIPARSAPAPTRIFVPGPRRGRPPRFCISPRAASSRSTRTGFPSAPPRSRGRSSTSGSRGRSAGRGSTTASPICSPATTASRASAFASTADDGTRGDALGGRGLPVPDAVHRRRQPDVSRRSIAVEPMTCPPHAFRTGRGVVRLDPGDSFTGNWGLAPRTAEAVVEK